MRGMNTIAAGDCGTSQKSARVAIKTEEEQAKPMDTYEPWPQSNPPGDFHSVALDSDRRGEVHSWKKTVGINTHGFGSTTPGLPQSRNSGEDKGTKTSCKRESSTATSTVPRKKHKGMETSPSVHLSNAQTTGSLHSMFDRIRRNAQESQENMATSAQTKNRLKLDRRSRYEAAKIIGAKCSSQDDGKFLIEGMSTTIHDYQLVGAAFMLKIERQNKPPRGGLVCDEMGVGKTLQAIACMMCQPRTKKDTGDGKGSTLIVLPSDVHIKQWKGEFAKHIADKTIVAKLFEYKGAKNITAPMLEHSEFTFTTYGQLMTDFKRKGILFKIQFYRVILDEADIIKNWKSEASKACSELRAKLKWALTGTPLKNSTKEIMSYFRFLGFDLECNADTFEELYGKPKTDEKSDRVSQVLASRMLRREKHDSFVDKRICELPGPQDVTVHFRMAEGERILYTAVEEKFREIIGNAERDGDENETSTKLNGTTLCLQRTLRQAVDHPLLIEQLFKKIFTQADLRKILDRLANFEGEQSLYDLISYYCDETEEGATATSRGFLELDPLLTNGLTTQEPGCVLWSCQGGGDLRMMSCKHIICRGCLRDLLEASIQEEKKNIKCPQCGKVVQSGLHLVNSLEDDLESVATVSTAQNDMRNRRPGDDYSGRQPISKASASRWLEAWDRNPKEPILSSAKTRATIDSVLEWQSSAPNDKIIIFTEWNLTARILGRMLQANDIQFLYYWGEKMNTQSRCKALQMFEENSSVKVLISSVSCGSTGLNITCANRVISLTPWWNDTREEQAFGRVYRHGQTKTTYFRRTIVEESIDERILELQRRKAEEIGEALAEGRKTKPSLTVKERLYLFNYDSQKHD